MTETKSVCDVYEENPFKAGFCRACKHPKSTHKDPYDDIINDLGGDEEEGVDENEDEE